MHKPFLCGGCSTFHRPGDAKSYPLCHYCATQYSRIKKLQARIVRERPHLGRLPPAELFERLYETLKKERTK